MSRKTALHAAHLSLGAKMGAFAGYDMPLYYGDGVIREHEWVRENAGLFDVSHMGQIVLDGPGVSTFLERLTPSSFEKMPQGRAQYTVLTNDKGGIVDDLIVTRLAEERFFLVLNAGCKDKDVGWIKSRMPEDVILEHLDDRALIAIQGPKAEAALQETMQCDVSDLPYMHLMETQSPCGQGIRISRLGYTGEDGFELSLSPDVAQRAWQGFLRHEAVKPVGLAARDSLRLEMGYCLYGHDINDETTPVEAGLSWVMGRDNTGFIGAEHILPQKQNGPARNRVGIRLLDKGVAREGSEIRNVSDEKIGVLTSGGFSPSLKVSIAQGYVPAGYADPGTPLFVNVRGRNIAAEVAAMPFIPAKTKSMKKKDAA